MKKRILAYLLALILMCNLTFYVSAESSLPDLSTNGSITFEMKLNDTLLNGGTMNICRVADIQLNGDKLEFVLIDGLKDTDVDMTKVSDLAVAEKVLKQVQKNRITKITSPITNGTVTFPNLPVGLYVVWQNPGESTKGYDPIQPFLISIPRAQGDTYVQDIVSKPKVPLVTVPPSPSVPPSPPPPHLPQTGQLNWPIPVLGGVGFALFALGLFLCSGRRSDDET